MRFVDEVEIFVEAGHGGSGCKSFRREAGVPLGGPDGGNGGLGGSVIAVASHDIHTLLDFRFQPRWKATDGDKGRGKNWDGKAGADLEIRVPLGTEIIEASTGRLVVDLTEDGQRFTLAKGGRGGKGNAFFKSPTRQAPEIFQPGEPGEQGSFVLSLKLMADVGIIGFPNAGKSTLISTVSAAKPKISNYPFTTITPNLGVVRFSSGKSCVFADIPGLIPGAHTGKGLGIQFLKHIERTRVLVHLIDPFQLDEQGEPIQPKEAYEIINGELKKFGPHLADIPQLVAITKLDAVSDLAPLEKIVKDFKKRGVSCFLISSQSGKGIQELLRAIEIALGPR